MKMRRPYAIILTISLVLACDVAGTWAYLLHTDFVLMRLAPRATYDVAVVFYGDSRVNRDLGENTLARLEVASRLFLTGEAKAILCVGGKRSYASETGSQQMRSILTTTLPAQSVFADSSSFDTISNLQEAKRIIDEHSWHSAVLVSSRLHLARIAIFAESLLKDVSVGLSAVPRPAIETWGERLQVWREVHYEWVSLALAKIIPYPLFTSLVQILRNTGLV